MPNHIVGDKVISQGTWYSAGMFLLSWDPGVIGLDESSSTLISLLPMASFLELPDLILQNQKDGNHRQMSSTKQRCVTKFRRSLELTSSKWTNRGQEKGTGTKLCAGLLRKTRKKKPQINQTSLEDRIRKRILEEGSGIFGILRRKGKEERSERKKTKE